MTYYRWNTKYIDHSEKALEQFETQKKTMVSYWGIGIVSLVICICGLVTKQYIIMMLAVLVGICGVWGIRDETWKKCLTETREMYLSTITLEQDIIVLRSGKGQLEKTVPYTEICGMERVMLPARIEYVLPDAKIKRPPVREKIEFICLYLDRCRLAPNVVFEDCWNNPRVILFLFYQSAWDILTDKKIGNMYG